MARFHGQEGRVLTMKTQGNNSGLDVNLRWMNVPKNLLISGATDNLRTEIDDVTIRYEDETISPTNPSSSGTFGKVSGYDLIEKNHWSGVDKFRYNSTLQALIIAKLIMSSISFKHHHLLLLLQVHQEPKLANR